MKNKKKVSSKIAIVIISLVILIMVCLSPNLIGKLLGNVNSINTSSSEGVNTGVVLNLNKGYNYDNNNPIKMKIYNGSDGEITINSIISRNYCPSSTDCEEFTITNLDTPIIVTQDEEVEYTITDLNTLGAGSGLINVGVQYSLTTDEDGAQVTKIYNIASTSLDLTCALSLSLNNQGINQQEKEFTFNSSADETGKDNVYVKLSNANIHMDITETLDDLNIYYSIKSGFGNKWTYYHPQSEDATTNKGMFDENKETNISNIKTYFSYTSPTNSVSGSGSFDYSNQFKLTGVPNGIYSNEDVILGFYFTQYKDSFIGGYDYWSDETTPFSSSEIPHFTLNVYDKSALKTAIENGLGKINSLDEEVDPDSWEDYINQVNNAAMLYELRDEYTYFSNVSDAVVMENYETREVTQTEINNMINTLNNTEITARSSADYTSYNNLLNEISSKKEEWYPADSYSEFKIVYDERTNYEGLSNSYQVKVDNYVDRLQAAFDTLNSTMYKADYTELNLALNRTLSIVNKTDDGKYELYTKDTWSNYQTALTNANEAKTFTIDKQSTVNEAATNLNNAIESLLEADADYTELYKALDRTSSIVNKTDDGKNELYTEDTWNAYQTALANANEAKAFKISQQSKVDEATTNLNDAIDNLTVAAANYSAVNAAKSTAEKLVNKTEDGKYNLYTDTSWNALQDAIDEVDYDLKIEDQEIVDGYAVKIVNAIAALDVAPAIYDDLKAIISEYKDTEAYNNNWYTDETKNAVEEYLKVISFDKEITEQSIVDTWVSELTPLVKALKLKKALGYLDSDDYHPFEGSLSIEGYVKYLKELDRSLYTDETLTFVDDIISIFENNEDGIMDITIDMQEEMDSLLESLDYIINNQLEKKPGDYTELCDYYGKALALNLDYYEDISNLRQVLWDINWDYKIDEQSLIDTEAEELRKALDALVMKDADYTEFDKAYKNAKNINSSYYTNYSIIEKAISQANSAKGLKIDKQSVVDEATSILNNALDSLVLKDADYSKINSLKVKIEQLDESKYTNFEIVKNALNTIVYGKKITEQDNVDNMYNELKNAYDNLIKIRANYAELENAIANAKKYESNKANYTNYQEVENLINSVNYNLTYDDQSKVDELTKKINEAVSNLNKKPANYAELSLILSRIPSDYSSYGNDLQNEIKALLEEVKKLPSNLKYDEQSKIDYLVTKAKNIIDKLPAINNEENSSSIVLSYLKVNDEKVDISSVPFKYVVEYSVVEAKITIGLASSNSTYKVYGGNVLMPGDNNVTIVVNTNDGKTYTYILVITRKTTSDYLSDLSVKESNIDFNKNKQEYTIKIDKNTDKLDLSAIAEDENAKVTIKGNKNLKNGSKVQIEVESTDGSVRVYTLNVQKAGTVDVRVVIILIMVLAVLAGVFKFIQVKKKIKEENNA